MWTWLPQSGLLRQSFTAAPSTGQMGGCLQSLGDYIIRGANGELHPCKPKYFAESFAAYVKGERDILNPDYAAFLDKRLIAKDDDFSIIKSTKLTRDNRVLDSMDKKRYLRMKSKLEKQGCPVIAVHGETKSISLHLERRLFLMNMELCI